VKFFPATLGRYVRVDLHTFELYNNNGGFWRDQNCTFEIVLKVPNDFLNCSGTAAMPTLFTEGENSDVNIICEDQTFKCHKSLLASKSDVFKAMFDTNQCTEQITGTVHVDDINAKTMNTLVKYMYQTKITIDEAMDLNLIVAADKYNIVDLVLKCEKIIVLTMSMKNIMDILAVAKLLPTPDLFEKAKLFFNERKDREKVQDGPKWMQLKTLNPLLAFEILESCLNMEKCTLVEDVKSSEDQEK
jgi:hypothetical protein